MDRKRDFATCALIFPDQYMFNRQKKKIAPVTVEQRAVVLEGKHIYYTLKRSSKRNSIGLRIDDRGLTVSVPFRSSDKWLYSVLLDKAQWVVEKLDHWESRVTVHSRWEDGGSVAYLGELLRLRVVPSLFAAPAFRKECELWVFTEGGGGSEYINNAIKHWYCQEAIKLFLARAAYYAELLNVAPRDIKLSSAKTQWGSCTAQGMVRLNYQLIKLPMRLVDYVVVHELAHLREMNHSSRFWRVVESGCPQYAKLRGELRAITIDNC